ncbi:undecaprenyldiphospho-muramoylpentapeptide beta-N-acetylglucosaminyltransferase [Desulfovibrio sp. OttesenSCG-928-A18]|nr:undecaprenyldiphospho-muramoylpentapeptide beta-N-acetylglucosaminyltransferase [Desulfovibrio sp. OttesenSCG-928-A18]
MERVIITTGGTGGHIFPALALAEELLRRNPRVMILFMGGRLGPEADLAMQAGLDFVGLPVSGFLGRGFRALPAAFGMGRAIFKAMGVLRKVQPEIVVGFGGYAAFAGVMAGRLGGRATAIHEQNAFPGMANRWLSRYVDRIFLSVPDASGAFAPEKSCLVGNPVRAGIVELHQRRLAALAAEEDRSGGLTLAEAGPEMGAEAGPETGPEARAEGPEPAVAVDRPEAPGLADEAGRSDGATMPPLAPARPRPRLLVMGGSQGAAAINDGLLKAMGPLLERGLEIWHQTGQADYDRVRAAYREAAAELVRVEPFITDMPRAYAWADLVLCRAGASTLAELCAVGLPALLTPFPYAAQDHQTYNARFLERQGAAVLLEQEAFAEASGGSEVLARAVLDLAFDRGRLEEMGRKSLALARPRAAADLADGLEELLAQKRMD